MGKDVLYLELKNRCSESGCSCKKDGDFIAEEHANTPGGYNEHIHRLRNNEPFTLFNVKYNGDIVKDPYNAYGITGVLVYYDNENRPYVIQLQKQGIKDYYVNNSPSNGIYGNTFWDRDNSLSNPERLKEKLEELSCKYAGSVSVDIFKKINRKKYRCSLDVNIVGTIFTDNIYEFKQTAQGNKPLKVHSIKYNGTEIPINIPPEGVKEISTFYWKHHLGKPLVVKVIDSNSKSKYYFNHGRVGLQWHERPLQPDAKLEDAVVEHNCVRNRTTTIDLSQKTNNKTYCCTKICRYEKVKVSRRSSDAFPGFVIYEHASDDGLPFTIGSIVKDGAKQGGIMFPIRHAYSVSVYYAEKCLSEPIFLEILYAKDGYREYKWYKRITRNGWDHIYNIPSTNTEINEDLRNNFTIVATLLTSGCSPNSIPEDKLATRPEPEPRESPKETLDDLKRNTKLGFSVPMGPDDDAEEEKKIEAEKQKVLAEGKQYIHPDHRTLNSLNKNPRTLSITPEKLAPIVTKVVEEVKQKIPAQQLQQAVVPSLPPVAALTASSGVIINIKEKPDDGNGPYLYPDGSGEVSLTKVEYPQGSGFYRFKHTKKGSNGQAFHVKSVQYGGSTVSDIKPKNGEPIKSYSVWYWSGDGNMNNPLFIEIENKNGTYDYHETKGSDWNKYIRDPPLSNNEPLPPDPLEQKLDDLNCQHNGAVVIDLTYDKYKGTQNRYCCRSHTADKKVSVTGNKVANTIPYYKHRIDLQTTLSGIKYYSNGNTNSQRKRIKLAGHGFPIPGSLSVYAFYCSGNDPKLIYINPTGKDQYKGWYKQRGSDNLEWEKVSGISQDPDNIKSCKEENFEQLVRELNCGYSPCPKPTQPSSPEQEPELKLDSDSKAEVYKGSEVDLKPKSIPDEKLLEAISKTVSHGLAGLGTTLHLVGKVLKAANTQFQETQSKLTADPSNKADANPQDGAMTPGSLKLAQYVLSPIGSNTGSSPQGENAQAETADGGQVASGVKAGIGVPDGATAESSQPDSTEALTAPQEGETPAAHHVSSPNSPPWVKPTSYVLTGVGVISGSLTGFGWWIYKRSKGDPWVRQI
ncbi:hypothetical protein BEWA_049870 [Theileria equi strain WA]|uniref:Uncharacterized protein n=1 Tax=Theileria equi strain WA TaxID=1537102 RepID=L1LB69_THEEQ|nr:hypothetical protein BEWA_049870 [Theileria equi strain WA]EKX72520.1 hypothetical protein BEWA_049870 [Theileria equi strain WA]|eukprot:XP_004831972.1 hypothetical protein BEWA_049870 [Theileria equi strain WA]